MGKNKLARWNELETLNNVFQPDTDAVNGKDHQVKGKWKKQVFMNLNPVSTRTGMRKRRIYRRTGNQIPG